MGRAPLRPDLDRAMNTIIASYKDGESVASLARRFDANYWSIATRLRKKGIRILSEEERSERRLNFGTGAAGRANAGVLRALVDGLMLGDGSIHPKGYVQIEQTKRRRGWLTHIEGVLQSIGAECRIIKIPPRTRTIEGRTVHSKGGNLLYTPCYVELKAERARWYPKGVKRVPDDVDLSPLALAYWFAGDGTYDEQGAVFFCTNGFLRKHVKQLAGRLTALGVPARCVSVPARENEFKISVTRRDDAQAFKEIVEPHMPACCRYKFKYVRAAKIASGPRRAS